MVMREKREKSDWRRGGVMMGGVGIEMAEGFGSSSFFLMRYFWKEEMEESLRLMEAEERPASRR